MSALTRMGHKVVSYEPRGGTALSATISPRKYCTVSDEIEGVLAHLNSKPFFATEKKNSVHHEDVREKQGQFKGVE